MARPTLPPRETAVGIEERPVPQASATTLHASAMPRWLDWDALRSLRYRSYRYYWLASLFTFTPWMMQFLIRGWLALQITESPLWVGLVAAGFQLPMLFLSMIGGVLADRFPRRNIVLTNEIVQISTYGLLAILFLTGSLDRWTLLGTSLASGIAFALAMPSRAALVPRLVPVADTMNGIVLSNGVFSSAQIIGPALGGVIIGAFGEGPALLTTMVLALPAPLLLLRVREERTPERNGESLSPFQEFLEGFRYVRGSAIVLGLIGLGAAGTMFAMPAQAFFPVFARDLQVGAQGLGILQGAVGFGSLVGIVFLSLQKGERPSTALLIGGSLAYGLTVTLFALSPVFWLSVALAFAVGVVGTFFLTINFTMVQLVVPDELRGRVLSIRMVIFGMQPVGQISGGAAAELITTKFAVALGGLICVGLMLLVLARAPQLRRL